MDSFEQWFKKRFKKIIFVTIFVIILGPLVVHISSKISAPCDFFITIWQPGDMLAYYGSALNTVGTIFIGSVAVWQTYKIDKETKLREADLAKFEKLKSTPIFDCKGQGVSSSSINIAVYNRSMYDAYNINIENAFLKDNKGNSKPIIGKLSSKVIRTGMDSSISFVFEDMQDRQMISFELICDSSYLEKLKYKIVSTSFDEKMNEFIYECRLVE